MIINVACSSTFFIERRFGKDPLCLFLTQGVLFTLILHQLYKNLSFYFTLDVYSTFDDTKYEKRED